MIKLYYICSLKSSIFLNFFKLDNQFFCRALKYIILRRKKLDKIILYKFYLILTNLIYLLLITEKNILKAKSRPFFQKNSKGILDLYICVINKDNFSLIER